MLKDACMRSHTPIQIISRLLYANVKAYLEAIFLNVLRIGFFALYVYRYGKI